MCLKGPLDSVPPADSSSRAACADPEGAAVADCVVGVPTSGWLIPPKTAVCKARVTEGQTGSPGVKEQGAEADRPPCSTAH